MITDPQPRTAGERREFERSDRLARMPLPPAEVARAATADVLAAIAIGSPAVVRDASRAMLERYASFYGVAVPDVRVLGVRPHQVEEGTCTYQLFGDYAPSTGRLRVWMRTAIRERVCSPKAFLATLLHEMCHHLDCAKLEMPSSYHTRGFYGRVDDLYHHALGTPPQARRPLVWVPAGTVWRIDWQRSTTYRGSSRR